MTNRIKSSEETITDGHSLHISDTKPPLESDKCYLKQRDLCKIKDITHVSY